LEQLKKNGRKKKEHTTDLISAGYVKFKRSDKELKSP
jgi:hypothetical protein